MRRGEDLDPGRGVSARFEAVYGAAPEVVTRAPGRVNLIGEHTDYNRGLCLPIALPVACHTAVRRRDDDRLRVTSQQLSQSWEGTLADAGAGQATGWAAYAVGVLWALAQEGYDVSGVDVLLDSRVPIGAGLSSSAAVECSVALAAATLLGLPDTNGTRDLLLRAGVRAETEVAGAPTGGLDQTVSLFATAGSALRLDFDDGTRRRVGLPLASYGLCLLVTDTRVGHALVDGGYAERRRSCARAAAACGVGSLRELTVEGLAEMADPMLRRRARHVVTENLRVDAVLEALARGSWTTLGDRLVASHASLRDDFEVSCTELDLAVETALEAGALGARMTGGGFGGSTVTLVREAELDLVADAIDQAFRRAGHLAPRHLVGSPSEGAGVLAAP